MPAPDDMWLYCGLSALVVVVFCCCFHVTELIKLRYLRKLTSADRFSLSGLSGDFSEGGSRSSTRRNTVVTPTPSASRQGSQGNFAIFTVITFPPGDDRTFQMKPTATASASSGRGDGNMGPRRSLNELLSELNSSTPNCLTRLTTVEEEDNVNSGTSSVGHGKRKEDLPPPQYDALFPCI